MFVWQKLNYMHSNPSIGKWQLVTNQIEYFIAQQNFFTGVQGIYPITNL